MVATETQLQTEEIVYDPEYTFCWEWDGESRRFLVSETDWEFVSSLIRGDSFTLLSEWFVYISDQKGLMKSGGHFSTN